MPESCSSNALNGCSPCGPNLSLFALSASTSQGKVGYGCLSGSSNDRYARKSGGGGRSSSNSDNFICENVTATYSYSSNESYSYLVDKFGIIAIGINANIYMTRKFSGSVGCEEPTDVSGDDDYSYKSIAKKTSCEEDQVNENGSPIQNLPGNLYCTPSPNQNCTLNTSCTTSTSQSFSASYSYFEGYWNSGSLSRNINIALIDEKNLQFFYDLCRSSVDTKIGLLEANQPQNCAGSTCGEGKDACWGAAGSFSIADNNLDDPNAASTISQKLKFKIATLKEGFDKTYQSVSGKVKFYIPSEEDIEEGRTPCCNSDFSGTVVKEAGYSISAGSTFKDDYLASDAGDFDNSDQSAVGQIILTCATIDSVSFI
jgi:hypothetical protein